MNRIIRFDGIAAMADAPTSQDQMAFRDSDCDWVSGSAARQYCRVGDDRLVAQAEQMIERFSAELNTDRTVWLPDVCGAYPCVHDVLAGFPDNMRRRRRVADESSPLAIYVNVGASHNITAAQMTARGTAILALVLGLSRTRPISLYVFSHGTSDYQSSREVTTTAVIAQINTTPLDIATAAYALTSPAFFRRIVHAIVRGDQGHRVSSWCDAWERDRVSYTRQLIGEFGGDYDNALVIEVAYGSDPLVRDPEAWLNDQIARFGGAE